jgi:site-specific recombinase XerD
MTEPEQSDYSQLLEQLFPGHAVLMESAQPSRRVFRGPKVLTSDSSFAIAATSYDDTPILLDAYGDIIEAPSKWLIYLRTMNTARGSVLQYASALCSFWRHLQLVARMPWDQVDDPLLQDWRNRMLAGVSREHLQKRKRTINKKLYVVVDFYRWCQEQGYVQNIIGVTPPGRQPYPIRLIEVVHRNQHRVTSPLYYKTRRSPLLPVPTGEEVDLLYVHLSGPHPADQRNVLLAKWVLDSGMRESEVLDRTVEELPTLAQCQALKDADRLYWMPIIGKGESPRSVPITPDVLIETHAFINTVHEDAPSPRDLMLKHRKKKSKEDRIFLSATRGEGLRRESVSHIFSRAFLLVTGRKDRRGLHFHRLRARFASKLVQELAMQTLEEGRSIHDPDEQRLILERAADILGHQDTKSLRYYLNAFIDRDEVAVSAAAAKSRRN